MNFKGQAKRMEAKDIEIIAGYLGCQVAAVRAVLAVESRGTGFDHHGRPKMLFEPHVFYRELGPGKTRDVAATKGVAYPKPREKPYPNDSYPRLAVAMELDETKALRSASWGLHQGMGFNYKIMGFETVQEYVTAMTYSEGAHLYAMGRFIVSKGIQKHLRAHNWSSFAKVYNGSDYAKHGYHTKLKSAYDARPKSEKYTPPPTSMAELNALLGLAVPPVPVPKPEYEFDDMTPTPSAPSVPWAIIGGVVVAAAAGFAIWFTLAN